MSSEPRAWIRRAASLRLTVGLLLAAMVLVFAGTIDQVNTGIHQAQEKYFRSFLVFFSFPGTAFSVPLLPGGYLLGILLLANLSAAMVSRFRFHWRKCGIWLLHGGLVLFLAAEVFHAWFTVEGNMRLDEGETRNYFESLRSVELVAIEPVRGGVDRVHKVPEGLLQGNAEIALPGAGLELKVRDVFSNSRLHLLAGHGREGMKPAADSGIGRGLGVERLPLTRRNDERNIVSATVEIRAGGELLGTWLLSNGLSYPQTVRSGDREFLVAIRNERHYRPYSFTLMEFRHERHPGTDTPRHFSSRLRLTYPERHEDRPVVVTMNRPFRYGGDIVYQSGFDNEDETSILRVVRNPAWPLPYVATAMTGLGLALQFGIGLVGFVGRGRAGARFSARAVRRGRAAGAVFPADGSTVRHRWVLSGFAAAFVAAAFLFFASGWRGESPGDFDFAIREFAALPAQANGRIQPMDAVARNTLLHLQGRTRVETPDGKRVEPAKWLLDALFRPDRADRYAVFRIESPDAIDLIGPGREIPAMLTYAELEPGLEEIVRQAMLADQAPEAERSVFQREILRLAYGIDLYQRLRKSFPGGGPVDFGSEVARFESLLPDGLEAVRRKAQGESYDPVLERKMVAFGSRYMRMDNEGLVRAFPAGNDTGAVSWHNAGGILVARIAGTPLPELMGEYAVLGNAWRFEEAEAFREAVFRIEALLRGSVSGDLTMARREARFLEWNLFNRTAVLYGAGLLLVLGSWMAGRREFLRQSGYWVLAGAFLLHTAGLLIRMYLHGRPPVTNLYASAVYVGWGTVLLGLIWERAFRDGLAAAGAGLTGIATLIVAHQLALAGDTLEALRAVLDSNFWLATHVLVIATGYSAMFLAGGTAAFGLARALCSRRAKTGLRNCGTMVYGVLCFATLFTFAGTVLGGIWADQSWGRFWGWDPKENGAMMIIIWNAIILHARMGGLIGDRGLLAMATLGNIVTAFAWFGVNLMGVGLHSYGFMDGGWKWFTLFAAVNITAAATVFLRKPGHVRGPHNRNVPA